MASRFAGPLLGRVIQNRRSFKSQKSCKSAPRHTVYFPQIADRCWMVRKGSPVRVRKSLLFGRFGRHDCGRGPGLDVLRTSTSVDAALVATVAVEQIDRVVQPARLSFSRAREIEAKTRFDKYRGGRRNHDLLVVGSAEARRDRRRGAFATPATSAKARTASPVRPISGSPRRSMRRDGHPRSYAGIAAATHTRDPWSRAMPDGCGRACRARQAVPGVARTMLRVRGVRMGDPGHVP